MSQNVDKKNIYKLQKYPVFKIYGYKSTKFHDLIYRHSISGPLHNPDTQYSTASNSGHKNERLLKHIQA